MKIIIVTLGSLGDICPFINIGVALQRRGHDVNFLGCDWFKDVIIKAGLSYCSLFSVEDANRVSQLPELWKAETARSVMVNHVYTPAAGPTFEFIEKNYIPEETILIPPTWMFGARFAQEKLHIPLLTVHLAPYAFLNLMEDKRDALDSVLYEPLRGIGSDLGVNPGRENLYGWLNSPEKICGLFPDWFGDPVHERRADAVLTGFPIPNGMPLVELPEELEKFLNQGDRPIVFTPGTGMRQASDFFQTSLEACNILGKRGVLLSPFEENIPDNLPDTVCYHKYVSLDALLYRSSALVYHGGVGSCAQALKAGIPHLVMPMAFDQFDNADRLLSLGVGKQISREEYIPSAVAESLNELVTNKLIERQCLDLASKFNEEDSLNKVCNIVDVTKQG